MRGLTGRRGGGDRHPRALERATLVGMSRRLLVVLSAVVAAVLAAATLAIASGGETSSKTATATTTTTAQATMPTTPARHGKRGGRGHHGGAMARMVQRVVLASFAGRLGVEPAALKTAIHDIAEEQFAKTATQAGLTKAQTDTLVACHLARQTHARKARSAACDRTVIRPAIKKLKALPVPDLAALKTELSDTLAAKLGAPVTGATVLTGARAELDERLGQAVALGFVSAKGRTLALACLDTPATCDIKALRKMVRGHGGQHARLHRR